MSDIIMENLNEYTELNESNCQFLTEEESGKKTYKIRGCFSKAGVKNLNNRVYPIPVMAHAVEEVQPLIKEGKFICELEHPASAKINIERIAAKINSLQMMEDGTVVGEAVILDTPSGNIIKNLVDNGVRLGLSTRGSGAVKKVKMRLGESLEEEEVLEVQEGFKLVAVDCVFSPSAGEFGSPEFVTEGINFNQTKKHNLFDIWKENFS